MGYQSNTQMKSKRRGANSDPRAGLGSAPVSGRVRGDTRWRHTNRNTSTPTNRRCAERVVQYALSKTTRIVFRGDHLSIRSPSFYILAWYPTSKSTRRTPEYPPVVFLRDRIGRRVSWDTRSPPAPSLHPRTKDRRLTSVAPHDQTPTKKIKQVVRDLAWALSSPHIISDDVDEHHVDIFSDVDASEALRDSREWLERLDADPSHLLRWVSSQRGTNKLGRGTHPSVAGQQRVVLGWGEGRVDARGASPPKKKNKNKNKK